MALASAPAVFSWKYDVFLNFRGEDTRRGFTDHLYEQLGVRAIKTFRDDRELKRGTDINPELPRAIDQSRSAIIVLSTNFASSSWCLRELTHIVRCMKEKERIFPIFYGVDPSDVRHQRGSFGEAFAEHEVNYRQHMEEVIEWRKSLKRVANLAGWNSRDYSYDTELIQRIVNTLWEKVHPTFSMLDSSERFVGIGSKLEEIDLLLDTDANDVRFIGIWGMGGVGKTTIARLVYERISHDFEGSSFLANVREVSRAHDGIAHLQKQLLSDILRENNIQVWNADSGITRISSCLRNKKVLLILDDVDQSDQLEKLVKQKEWFGFGSRIVITTRDERLFVEHGMEMVYEVKPLTQDEALFLFSWKALKDDELEEDFLELSKCFISHARGLPLALKTLGSFLYKRGRDEWKSALDKLKQAPNRTIFETLKVSYDGLDELEKRIFLDIACFHKSCGKEGLIDNDLFLPLTLQGEFFKMEPDKGWFLYLQKNHELFALNISKLLAWSSLEKARRPPRPDFKLVNASCYPDGSMVPFGTRYMIVGSNPYIVGGQFGCPHPLLGYDYWPNFDVIASDPATDDPCKSNLPMLSGPKFYPFVITLENKIYVLSLQYRGYITETWPALFEVYDPESGKWKILPNPPFVVGKTVTSPAAHHYYALGHKLVVTNTWSVESYVFDTREEKWEPWDSREDPFEIAYKPLPTLARFKDFLVAVRQGDFGDVLTYRLDSFGIPRRDRNLVELENIFLPLLDSCFPFITEINDAGLMCIVCYSGIEQSELWRLRVVVFQVSISGHLDNQFLCADIKAKGTYYFCQRIYPIIFPPVITSDRLDKHDNKPDVFWKKENLSRLDREFYDAWCSGYWGALKGSSSTSGQTQDGQEKEGNSELKSFNKEGAEMLEDGTPRT